MLGLAVVAPVLMTAAVGQSATDFRTLTWLTGTYEGTFENRNVEMMWGNISGNTIMGTRKQTEGPRSLKTEYFVVRLENNKVVLDYAFGDRPLELQIYSYKLSSNTATSLVFTNPVVKFPHTIELSKSQGNLRVGLVGRGTPTRADRVEDPNKRPDPNRSRNEQMVLKPKR